MPDINLSSLKGVTNAWDNLVLNQLVPNLISFFEWGLLQAGGYFNVTISTSGAYGGNQHVLHAVKDPNFNNGQVFESHRMNWVWQSGVPYNPPPINVSGIYINSVFYPTSTTGAFSYYINYPDGRVIFNTAIALNSTVQLNYSYNWANFINANSTFFRQAQFQSMRVDNTNVTAFGSGEWSQIAKTRPQLPLVAVEVVPNTSIQGLALGGGQIWEQGVAFHVLAETDWERNQLMSILLYQDDKTIFLYDTNLVNSTNSFPLNQDGMVVNPSAIYPNLINNQGAGAFFYKRMVFKDMSAQNVVMYNPTLFGATVKAICEIRMPEI